MYLFCKSEIEEIHAYGLRIPRGYSIFDVEIEFISQLTVLHTLKPSVYNIWALGVGGRAWG